MKKITIFLFVNIFPLLLNSQVINIKTRSIRDVYQIVNQENNISSIFFIENKRVVSYLLDDNFATLDTLSFPRPDKKFRAIAGHTYSNDSYTIIWKSEDKNEFFIQEIDFKNNKVINKSFLTEPLEKEILKTIQEKDRLIFVRIKEESNIVKIISFDNKNNFDNKNIDLSSINLSNSKNTSVKFKDIVLENNNNKQNIVEVVDRDLPTSLVKSSNKKKIYCYNNKLLLSFDNNSYSTQVININLNDYSFNYFEIKNHLKTKGIKTEYNSFIIDDLCFGLNVSENRFTIFIKDFENKILVEKSFTSEDEITFKNSDIIQIGGEFADKRVLSTTKQFLRKVNSLNPSLSVYPLKNKYMLTIGSVSDLKYSYTGGMFGFFGSLAYSAMHNPTFDSFLSYADRKVVYFNTILDKNLNQQGEPSEPIAFDKIETMIKRMVDIKYFTIFKKHENYVFGYYNYDEGKYIFRKTSD